MKPLVSILIPAYNVQDWISDSIKSALAQTWPRTEIIVVDDGSTDRTAEIARTFCPQGVRVVSKENEGAAATRNHAFNLCCGDYIQWLDGDDLLVPEKIERQLAALDGDRSARILLSGPWGSFRTRVSKVRFIPDSLWNDLEPVDWLIRKMGENLHMQTATWLTSRELAESAGEWDTRLLGDDDGEYFCRVLLASERTRFVPEGKVYYRRMPTSRLSYIGASDRKMDAMLVSMKLHIGYILSLEESERTRNACVRYLHTWAGCFHPERPDIISELEAMARDLGGELDAPKLRWKYRWVSVLAGKHTAKRAQHMLPNLKQTCIFAWDRFMSRFERGV